MRETRSVFTFEEPIERLWSAVTVYEVLVHWLADEVRGRPKVGGEFSWTWNLGLEGQFTSHGTYKKIERLKELVMEWKDHPAGDVFLQLIFESTGPKSSKLTIVNGGFPDNDTSNVWLESAKDAWDGQAVHLKEFLKNNSDISKFIKKS